MIFIVTLMSAVVASAADLTPEATKYINSPPFSTLIKFNDPRFRTAEAGPTFGHYWKNGKEIENTDNYLKGVRNWQDSQGFTQEDNFPNYEPKLPKQDEHTTVTKAARVANYLAWHKAAYGDKQVGYTPEKAARIAHEKAWHEAAYGKNDPGAAAAQSFLKNYHTRPSQSNYQQSYQNYQQGYNPYQKNYDFQGQASDQQQAAVFALGQAREGKFYNQYQDYYTTTPKPVPTGPRGFFYSYNYPVSITVPKNEASQQGANPGYPVDHDTISQY